MVIFKSKVEFYKKKIVQYFSTYAELKHALAFASEPAAMLILKYQACGRAMADNQHGFA